ncbi:hypothetical protein [Desmospora activa]|uniref:Uncharacterized protein n=1 Tax=Desmospora activa DSM 45169 TaxID=1121389 RepID=A0A2T4Z838_9BACL|nr:hypothetical protein [Desmospora activa]PTM58056.1 hypothetical protein C8J48_0628 [Desmospora activa DSM 45169]
MLNRKYGLSLMFTILMLIVAVPRLPVGGESTLGNWFAISWLVFAYLVIAANWRMVLQVDREKQRRAEADRRRQWLKTQQRRRGVRLRGW